MNSQNFASRQLATAWFVLAITFSYSCVAAGAGRDGSTANDDSQPSVEVTVELLSVAANRIMDQHIQPPTLQQMYLGAAQAIYEGNGQSSPSDLARRVSSLSKESEFQALIQEVWQKAKDEAGQKFSAADTQAFAIDGLLEAPRVRFSDSKQHRIQKQLAENQYVGIGIRLSAGKDFTVINHPFFGGPAYLAGARTGDQIVEINGADTKGWSLGQVIEELRGQKGTDLTVVVENLNRGIDEPKRRELKMTRNVVPIVSVHGTVRDESNGKWKLDVPGGLNPSGKKLAYIRIESIVGSTAAELQQIGNQVQREKFEGAILDFRSVAPADMHFSIMLADSFCGKCELAKIESRGSVSTVNTTADHTLRKIPLAVIADPAVAGTTFLVLSALKETGRAKFVGLGVRSEGLCSKSIELDGFGALEDMAYAICKPANLVKPRDEIGLHDLMGNPVSFRGQMLIPTDIPVARTNWVNDREQLEQLRRNSKTISEPSTVGNVIIAAAKSFK